jgi:hypothetical protein
MIYGPLDFFGLLPSALSIVKGIRSRSRWANHDEIPLTLINDRRQVRAVDGWAPCVRDCAVDKECCGGITVSGNRPSPEVLQQHDATFQFIKLMVENELAIR